MIKIKARLVDTPRERRNTGASENNNAVFLGLGGRHLVYYIIIVPLTVYRNTIYVCISYNL